MYDINFIFFQTQTCSPSFMVIADGKDNDCDGLKDEEVCGDNIGEGNLYLYIGCVPELTEHRQLYLLNRYR